MTQQSFEPVEIPPEDLTWREQEVLGLLSERLTNQEIADRLHLAESTVKDYVGRILGKLHVKNRRQAVARAVALDLLGAHDPTAPAARHNLPAETTPFIGRDVELAEIQRLIAEQRLLTLTGPGGIGKTRLALEAAAAALDDFEHGVYFVSLAPVESGERIVMAILEALNLPLSTEERPAAALQRYLRRKQMLIVLDNFEHLLENAALVSELLAAAPDLKILATSREKLGLHGETALAVGGMSLGSQQTPDAEQSDAVLLFLQRARQARPGMDLGKQDQAQVVEICKKLGGMPLAVELAAGWLHVLSVREIGAELEAGLDILTTRDRDVPARHRSMQDVFDHSWVLMNEAERDMLKALSVFRSGFDRAAARRVAGATLQSLADMVDKSLLQYDPGASRYTIHELLRQHAQIRLDEAPEAGAAAREAHAAYFAEFMAQRWEHLKDSRQLAALQAIEADIDNIRLAWQYCLAQKDVVRIRMFFSGLRLVYWVRGWYQPAQALFGEVAAVLSDIPNDPDAAVLEALATANQAFFLAWLGRADRGYPLALESVKALEGAENPQDLADAFDGLSLNSYYLNKHDEERQAAQQIVAFAEEAGDRWRLGYGLFLKSIARLKTKADEQTQQYAQVGLEIKEEIGDELGTVMPLQTLGHWAEANGKLEEARAYYLRSLEIAESFGFRWAIGNSSKYLGHLALTMNNLAESEEYLLRNLRIADEVGLTRDLVNLLVDFARLRMTEGKPEQAVELLSLALKQPAIEQARFGSGPIKDSADTLLSELEEELDQDRYRAAKKKGQALKIDDWVAKMTGATN